MTDDLHPIVRALVVITSMFVGIFALWCTVVAFTGGKIPMFLWELEGCIVLGWYSSRINLAGHGFMDRVGFPAYRPGPLTNREHARTGKWRQRQTQAGAH